MSNEREYKVKPHNIFYTILTRDCEDKDPNFKEFMLIDQNNDKFFIPKFPVSEMERIVYMTTSEQLREELANYEFEMDEAHSISIRKDPSTHGNYVMSIVGGYEEAPECSLSLVEIRGLFGTLKR